ncbi:MAG: hypothetical protein K5912_00365 [Alphaproteobacteria bacterium]|nr:hypothetical protein [Alphaproteobacteria bacterium]
MKKLMKKFLSKILIAVVAVLFVCPGVFAGDEPNLLTGDVGDFGGLTTEHNQTEIINGMKSEFDNLTSGFEKNFSDTGVPVEAKVGVALVGGLSFVSEILNNSLVRFVNMFLLLAFFFWLSFEIYKTMTEGKGIPWEKIKEWIKKGAILGIWLLLLSGGLQELFSLVVVPVIGIGSYMSELILDSISSTGNVPLADTCESIRQYTASNIQTAGVIDAETAANIMCVPTRLSQFYYSAIKYGWSLVVSSFGVSGFTFVVGVIFVGLFTYAAFKFAFVAFSVIAELFLVIILLPFTAISETVGKTSFNGIAGQIFNAFLGLFKSMSLSEQINKFVQTTVYFVSMSIIVSIGGAILANAVAINSQNGMLTVLNGDTFALLMSGALVAYLAFHIDDIAKQIGGAIDYATKKDSLGMILEKDTTGMLKGAKDNFVKFVNALRHKN